MQFLCVIPLLEGSCLLMLNTHTVIFSSMPNLPHTLTLVSSNTSGQAFPITNSHCHWHHISLYVMVNSPPRLRQFSLDWNWHIAASSSFVSVQMWKWKRVSNQREQPARRRTLVAHAHAHFCHLLSVETGDEVRGRKQMGVGRKQKEWKPVGWECWQREILVNKK